MSMVPFGWLERSAGTVWHSLHAMARRIEPSVRWSW
jgi:hypothetical protein